MLIAALYGDAAIYGDTALLGDGPLPHHYYTTTTTAAAAMLLLPLVAAVWPACCRYNRYACTIHLRVFYIYDIITIFIFFIHFCVSA